jgi:hypothetical protein
LLLAGGKDHFLKFYDRSVANGSVVDVLQSLRDIKRGLEEAEASDKHRGHVCIPFTIKRKEASGLERKNKSTHTGDERGFAGRFPVSPNKGMALQAVPFAYLKLATKSNPALAFSAFYSTCHD